MATVDRDDVKLIKATELTPFRNNVQIPPEKIDFNNNLFRARYNTLAEYVTQSTVAVNETNTFSVEQIFSDFLRTNKIENLAANNDIEIVTNNGSIYKNDKTDPANELVTKGYVNLTVGNIPLGGTVNNWLEGNGLWSDPRWYSDESSPASGFTAVNKGNYVLSAGDSIQLPPPSAGLRFIFRPQIGQDLTRDPANAITLLRNDSENIAGTAMNLTCSVNGEYTIFSNGTDWDFRIAKIGRKR